MQVEFDERMADGEALNHVPEQDDSALRLAGQLAAAVDPGRLLCPALRVAASTASDLWVVIEGAALSSVSCVVSTCEDSLGASIDKV